MSQEIAVLEVKSNYLEFPIMVGSAFGVCLFSIFLYSLLNDSMTSVEYLAVIGGMALGGGMFFYCKTLYTKFVTCGPKSLTLTPTELRVAYCHGQEDSYPLAAYTFSKEELSPLIKGRYLYRQLEISLPVDFAVCQENSEIMRNNSEIAPCKLCKFYSLCEEYARPVFVRLPADQENEIDAFLVKVLDAQQAVFLSKNRAAMKTYARVGTLLW